MKKIIFLLIATLLFSCNSDNDPELQTVTNKIVLLKVDFLTNTFEGGKEYEFSTSSDFTISSTYAPPGDFGDVQLYYNEIDEKIFDGTIHWMGLGERTYPAEIDLSDSFSITNDQLPFPDNSEFQKVMYDEYAYYPENIEYENIWSAINNLEIVATYRKANPTGNIHLFLYTPIVGVGDPADWDWYIFIKN